MSADSSAATPEQFRQDALFDGDFSVIPESMGFRGPVACKAAGITYRQLDYWARTGLVTPHVRDADGSGTQRLYSFHDILMLKVVRSLLDAGISLQQIRIAIDHLRQHGVEDLTGVTLMSDGVSVYEATSDSQVVDLLRGGQGMFAIALSGVWRDIEGTVSQLPREHTGATNDTATATDNGVFPGDELAQWRARKQAS